MDTARPPAAPDTQEEQALLITADMLVPVRPKDPRVPFEKGMSYFPVLISLLIIANVAVYLWEIATGALSSKEAVIAAGALYRENILAGEVWRLITAAFLHGSLDHILGNTVFMYILGLATEHAFGLPGTAAIYLFAALTGSLLSIAMAPGPGVGASGAIFGLMGALTLVFYRRRADFFLRDRSIGAFVGALAVLQIFLGFTSPYVDNWAHLGGFLGGALAALVLRPALGEESRTVALTAKALLAGAFALAAGLYLGAYGYLAAVEANVWLHYGNKPAALAAADRALEKNPGNGYMYLFRGMLYFDAKQYAAAESDFAAYLRLGPDSAQAWHAVGQTYYESGQYPKAIAHYTQALAREPGNVHYLNSRGYTYILTGEYAAARADFIALLAIDARYAPGWGNLGLIDAFQGDYAKAVGHLEKAYLMDPAQAPLKSLIAGLRAEMGGRRAEAVKNYETFVAAVAQERINWLAEIAFAENRARILRGL